MTVGNVLKVAGLGVAMTIVFAACEAVPSDSSQQETEVLTGPDCPQPGSAAPSASGERIAVLGCSSSTWRTVFELEGGGATELTGMPATDALTWIDGTTLLTAGPADGEGRRTLLTTYDVTTREVVDQIQLEGRLAPEPDTQITVYGERALMALTPGRFSFPDMAWVNLGSGDATWITRTPDTAETAGIQVPDGMLIAGIEASLDIPGMDGWLDLYPSDGGAPTRVAESISIDRLQLVGDLVYIGGRDNEGSFGSYNLWATREWMDEGVPLQLVPTVAGRWPTVQADGYVVSTRISPSVGGVGTVVRSALGLAPLSRGPA
jgi:hypothetical protein